jgi:protein phosphatase
MSPERSSFDRRELTGPFDIVGDVHGCCDELEELLAAIGYRVDRDGDDVRVTPPDGRTLVFVGDLVDRGPRTPDVLRIAMSMAEQGTALCVEGNHDSKLVRWLKGANVKTAHGLQLSIDQLMAESAGFRKRVTGYLESLPPYLWLDGGALVVAHAGLKEEMIGKLNGKVRSFALYGDTTGETDEFGSPVRRNWALDYQGLAAVIYGHVAAPEVQAVNNTWCIDTGCCFGGALTTLRWPERELVSIPARRAWFDGSRPLDERQR